MWKFLVCSLTVFCTGLAVAPVATAGSVTVWHAYRTKEKAALEKVVSTFNAKTFNAKKSGTQIKLVSIPYDALADKITAAIPRGRGPDLFIFAQDRVGDWAAAEVIEPVDFWLKDEVRSTRSCSLSGWRARRASCPRR